jgi:hypothetical protein
MVPERLGGSPHLPGRAPVKVSKIGHAAEQHGDDQGDARSDLPLEVPRLPWCCLLDTGPLGGHSRSNGDGTMTVVSPWTRKDQTWLRATAQRARPTDALRHPGSPRPGQLGSSGGARTHRARPQSWSTCRTCRPGPYDRARTTGTSHLTRARRTSPVTEPRHRHREVEPSARAAYPTTNEGTPP